MRFPEGNEWIEISVLIDSREASVRRGPQVLEMARDKGVDIKFLTALAKITPQDGALALECQRNELGTVDAPAVIWKSTSPCLRR
ncbi:MAG: hypothetical protein HY676_00910 [Chloroflexi bacterium]|nr:hypothetical protein [Chloroflexota bacterium]